MMERTFVSILLAMLFILCSNQSAELKGEMIFSSKIENPNSESIELLDLKRKVVQQIQVSTEGKFSDTFEIQEGYYYLNDGNESTPLYLKPGFNLTLSMNTAEFDESIVYKGKGAVENNYLAQKALMREGFGQLNYYAYYVKLSEERFLTISDSLFKLQKDFLEKQKDISADFSFIELKTLGLDYNRKISEFEGMKRYLTAEKDFKVSDQYPDAYANINLSDEKLLKSPAYLNFIESYLRNDTSLISENDERDFTLAYTELIVRLVKNKKIKEELLYNVGFWQLDNTGELEQVFQLIQGALKKETYINEVTEKYQRLQKIQKGKVSPTFELKDINGAVVKLSDLKGQLVYIDVWATWCMPCMIEIPHLKELEEHFKGKDIQFVSICIMDKKESWHKMVTEKELGGIQLFAPDPKIPFIVDYMIYGIPKFILLDANGNILDANAMRPSNPSLVQEIEKRL